MYHFISGYTAKVAGTEMGVTEPQTTFSPCFGGPFLVWRPSKYAELLAEKMRKHHARVWLVNTGWTGGPYGTGSRMKIAYTRAMINAALSGALDSVTYERNAVFNLDVPTACPDVPAEVLNPRNTWPNPADYDAQAAKLANMFVENFKAFEGGVSDAVKAAGISWWAYQRFMKQHEKPIEEERLVRVPAELDLTPYRDEKDFALLRRLVQKERGK